MFDASSPVLSGTDVERDTTTRSRIAPDVPWQTVVWNDPVNLMSYVTHVFRNYFGYSKPEAERLMLQVHNDGRAIVATGPREEMERHTEAMHEFGLWATVDRVS
jgi:ATP-dependent Clp protease adaptor protein ClpS